MNILKEVRRIARPREPIDLIIAKGKKNLTKAEIAERRAQEIQAPNNNIQAPSYLPKTLVKEFDRIAAELIEIGIMSNLDSEALARFITSEYNYQKITKKILKFGPDNKEYYDTLLLQEKLFKMVRQSANDLGLTISSRCKLVVPKKQEEVPKNKFNKFM
jgi:P27 family predicted phage terminase small subunit